MKSVPGVSSKSRCGRPVVAVTIATLGLWAVGCLAVSPAPRLDQYLGTSARSGVHPERIRARQGGPLNIGLVVVHDTVGNRAEPAVLKQSKSFLTDRTRGRVEGSLPFRITAVLETETTDPSQALEAWRAQARGQRLDHVLVALFSNEQTDTPDSLLMDGSQEGGGAMGRVLGITTTNFALAELAVLSLGEGNVTVLARAEGRTWGTLERLANGVASNAYPAIRLSGRSVRVTPPADEASAKMCCGAWPE
jgi:hypothetical protein